MIVLIVSDCLSSSGISPSYHKDKQQIKGQNITSYFYNTPASFRLSVLVVYSLGVAGRA